MRKVCSKERLHLNLVRLRYGKQTFEIDVYPDKAIDFKNGEKLDIREVLKAENIFANAKTGDMASKDAIQQAFGTTDPLDVAKHIILKGEIQLAGDYRAKLREEKRRKVLYLIASSVIDSRTNAPVPVTRLEGAFLEAKIKIDEIKPAKTQVERIIKRLMRIIPIKMKR